MQVRRSRSESELVFPLAALALAAGGCATSAGHSTGGGHATPSVARADHFASWPAGSSPQEIGRRLIQNYLDRQLDLASPMHYAEACTWYGALTTAKLIPDTTLDDRLIARFAPILTPAGAAVIPPRAHVDDRVFGIVPLESPFTSGGLAGSRRSHPGQAAGGRAVDDDDRGRHLDRGALLGRRPLHDPVAAGAGVSRDPRRRLPGSRGAGGVGVPGQAAAAERSLLPHRAFAAVLGTRQRLVRGGDGGAAARAAGGPPAARAASWPAT